MGVLVSTPLLLVGVPFILALLAAVSGRKVALLAPAVSIVAPLVTLGAGISALSSRGTSAAEGSWMTSALVAPPQEYGWFRVAGRALTIVGVVDTLTAVMLVVVGLVAACVVVFSVGYMKDDEGWARYFALIAAFTGAMNLLVVAGSLTALFVGWELVGACSYLLIGFWYRRPSASRAAIKAFVTTRVGDVGLLLGIAILWSATGTDGYQGVVGSLGAMEPGLVNAAAVCLAIGAMGKSAQFPFHGWLPDAMEGPTPVSALIHAATMVAAGVYLVARLWPIFEAADVARSVLLAAGVVSALGAALIALGQNDIKKVLAYSTISQIGFMFAALGAGAWHAAFFHLVTHAAFKALLFLSSGSVIHGSGTQDLRLMGVLRRAMPVTFGVWLVGVVALAGVPPLAGFFSKDAVLEVVLHASPAAGVALFAASLLTALYSARATRLAFFGQPAPSLHAHESGASMLGPLVVLALAAASLGFAGDGLISTLGGHAEPLSVPISLTATALALAGGALGALRPGLLGAWPRIEGMLASGLGWDRFVDAVLTRPVVTASRALWAWGDRLVLDGAVELSAILMRAGSRATARLHTGDVQAYATAVTAAVALGAAALIWLGR